MTETSRKDPDPPPLPLVDQGRFLQAVFADAPLGVCLKDRQGRYVMINRAGERLIGRSAAEIVGLDDRALFPRTEAERIMAVDQRVMADGRPWTGEERLTSGPAQGVFLAGRCPCRDGQGRIIGVAGIIQDHRDRDAALRQREQQYRSIVEGCHDAICVLDDQSRIGYANEALCRLSGYSREELFSRNFLEFIVEEDRQRVADCYERRQRGDQPPSSYGIACILRDGSRRDAEMKVFAFRDTAGRLRTVCQIFDVTEALRMEGALRKSEERLRRVTDNMVDLVIQVDQEAVIEFVSPSVKKLLGYEIRELIGEKFSNFFNVEDVGRSLPILKRAVQGETKLELRIRHRDGRDLWFEVVGNAIRRDDGRIIGAVLGGRDITEKKAIAEDLRQSEEKFRALTESTIVTICVIQGDEFRYVNPAFTALTGYTLEDLAGMKFWDVVAPSMRDMLQERGLARQRGEQVPSRYEMRFITKTGEERVADFGASYIKLDNRPAMIGTVFDITDRKIKEDELRLSEERYRTILENIEDGYFEVDLVGNLMFASEPCLKITQSPWEVMKGMNFRQYTPKEDWPKVYESFYRVFSTGEAIKGLDWDVVRLDGSRLRIESSVSLIRDAQGRPTGFRGIIRDVTERKRAEENVQWMAYHDLLTGLPNRALFYDRTAMILAQAKRKGRPFGVMMLDLDKFKDINDNFGHDIGDEVLIAIADRLKKLLRDEDTVARTGGDEFVILLPDAGGDRNVGHVTERIMAAFSEPIVVRERPFFVSFSIGTAIYPDDGDNIDILMRCADQSMYRFKAQRGVPSFP
ncbi:MAG: PAS domain S-box protein [Deltaproteobacteria bacterium]|nr:PAS domain S-box protein [Deltaproteobacteria bacterium]